MFQLYHLINTKKTPYIKRHERDRRQIFKGLLHFEWVKNVARAWESGSGQGVAEFFVARNRGMICRCVPHDGWSIRTASQAVAPVQPYTASSGLPRRGSCGLFAGEKPAGGVCGRVQGTFYDRKGRRMRALSCGDTRLYLEVEVRRGWCRSCGAVKQEKLPWVSPTPFYTNFWVFRKQCG